ncbi:MAG: desulfoferrodoxin [bacterium]|nr:desulfoferrodoxin [bacterium]
MAEPNGIYKCNICGNIVEVLKASGGDLVCCGEPMELLKEKIEDEGKEKHVPVVETEGNKVMIKVGSVPHPMEDAHYIQLIELIEDDKVVASTRLFPGQKPEAEFDLESMEKVKVRALCNVHGLWKS